MIFKYMPRVTITPGVCEAERIEELVRRCIEYRYDEVMFFVNAENLYRGFVEISSLVPQVELIKRAKSALAVEGIKVSVNPWTSIGQTEWGFFPDNHGFRHMVDANGKAASMTACPLDESWRAYVLRYYEYLAKEIEPETIWVEDDFRLHNHYPLHWGGCFCDEHMKLYCDRLGKNVGVKEFAEGISSDAEGGAYRKVFYEVNRVTMRELAEFLGNHLRTKYPRLQIGLMSSDPKMHSIEGRDWKGVLCGLGGETPIDRIHLPMYRQSCLQDYCWVFNDISMSTRALIPEDTVVLPEVENAMFSPYTKSINTTRFQVESSLALLPKGITLDLDCFAGNGIVAEYGYGDALAGIKDYLNAFVGLELQFHQMQGISVPVSEDAFLRAKPCNDLTAIHTEENWWASYFASCGIAYKYEKVLEQSCGAVALSGEYLNGLTDLQIRELFKNTFVILDGNSVEILFSRGLSDVIGAERYRVLHWEEGHYTHEQAERGRIYLGIEKCRTSATVTCPAYVKIDYKTPPTVYTRMYDSFEQEVGLGIVRGSGFLVLPFLCQGKQHGLLSSMRVEALKTALSEGKVTSFVYTQKPYLSVYYYSANNYDVALLVNFSDDEYKDVSLCGLGKFFKMQILNRNNSAWQDVKTITNGNKTVIKATALPSATVVLKIYKE